MRNTFSSIVIIIVLALMGFHTFLLDHALSMMHLTFIFVKYKIFDGYENILNLQNTADGRKELERCSFPIKYYLKVNK